MNLIKNALSVCCKTMWFQIVEKALKGQSPFQLFASLNSLKGLSTGQSLEWLGYHNENLSPEEPTSAKRSLSACV